MKRAILTLTTAVALTLGGATAASATSADCVTHSCGGPSISTGGVAGQVAKTGYDGANEWCTDNAFGCAAGFFVAGAFTSWITG